MRVGLPIKLRRASFDAIARKPDIATFIHLYTAWLASWLLKQDCALTCWPLPTIRSSRKTRRNCVPDHVESQPCVGKPELLRTSDFNVQVRTTFTGPRPKFFSKTLKSRFARSSHTRRPGAHPVTVLFSTGPAQQKAAPPKATRPKSLQECPSSPTHTFRIHLESGHVASQSCEYESDCSKFRTFLACIASPSLQLLLCAGVWL